MRGEVRAGRWEGVARRWRKWHARAGARGAEGMRGAHVKHEMHVRDAGRVEVQRLVERHRMLPSQGHTMRGKVRNRRGGRAWGGGSAHVRARPD